MSAGTRRDRLREPVQLRPSRISLGRFGSSRSSLGSTSRLRSRKRPRSHNPDQRLRNRKRAPHKPLAAAASCSYGNRRCDPARTTRQRFFTTHLAAQLSQPFSQPQAGSAPQPGSKLRNHKPGSAPQPGSAQPPSHDCSSCSDDDGAGPATGAAALLGSAATDLSQPLSQPQAGLAPQPGSQPQAGSQRHKPGSAQPASQPPSQLLFLHFVAATEQVQQRCLAALRLAGHALHIASSITAAAGSWIRTRCVTTAGFVAAAVVIRSEHSVEQIHPEALGAEAEAEHQRSN